MTLLALLVGDRQQLQSIEAGAAFRALVFFPGHQITQAESDGVQLRVSGGHAPANKFQRIHSARSSH